MDTNDTLNKRRELNMNQVFSISKSATILVIEDVDVKVLYRGNPHRY